MKIAIIGATGMVGNKMLECLEESNILFDELILAASERSINKKLNFKSKQYSVISMSDALESKPDIALFSAGGEMSLVWAPKFAEQGTVVIDNSSAWRLNPNYKLIVPEVNAHLLSKEDKIIANPNCSTIQLVLVLNILHNINPLKRVIVSTYQSVTGTGVKAVRQLENERNGISTGEKAYNYQIDLNLIPQIDVFLDNDYTKEEQKIIDETRKILNLETLKITSTAVRVPVIGGHCESVNIEFENKVDINIIKEKLKNAAGIKYYDDKNQNIYPMPIISHNNDFVWVGRLRNDNSCENAINLWIAADNLRKGAATNTVQIAKYIIENNLL